eukprot:scaffold97995_cov67-Phaeocystis_antarctica.AAC.3
MPATADASRSSSVGERGACLTLSVASRMRASAAPPTGQLRPLPWRAASPLSSTREFRIANEHVTRAEIFLRGAWIGVSRRQRGGHHHLSGWHRGRLRDQRADCRVDFASEHLPAGNSEPTIREAQTSLCDRGRVYGSCPTTTARFLRVAVTYTIVA